MTLNLNCAPTGTTDETKIIIRDDHFTIIKNGKTISTISLKDCVWIAENVISYTVDFPKNSVITLDLDSFSSESVSGFIMLAVMARNSVLAEKNYENDKLYYQRDVDNAVPLGQLNVISGSNVNRVSGIFKFYNGTPNAVVADINDGQYDATLDIVFAF